jgi:DNA-binding NarL/FixJ family response regulator
MIEVMITDDHRVLVDGLRKLVDDSRFAHVCSTAFTGRECLKMLGQSHPDVLFLDINLPDYSGLDLCKQIKNSYPSVKIIALTSYSEYVVVREMMENGASGYVLKNAMPEEILLSIETVYRNETFLCEQIDLQMRKRSADPVWLTPREKELLAFVADGFTNSEIAEKMFLSVETINSYRKNLLFKLNARNTAVMVRIALEQRLIR